MISLPIFNRHAIGIFTVLAVIAALGVGASWNNRPVKSLDGRYNATQSAANTTSVATDVSSFLSSLGRVPKNAFGSAANMSGPAGATNEDNGSSETSSWSQEEWQSAIKAVNDLRAKSNWRKTETRSTETKSTDMSDAVWQPPEEIAGKIHKN